MTREEHLKFCKNCTKKKFDRQNGIICSITNKIADFENECSHYQENEAKAAQKEVNKTMLESLKQKGEIKISSSFSFIGLFIGATLILVMTPVLAMTFIGQNFHVGMVFATLVYIALISFIVYQFIYVCDARINGDKITLKKLFRPAKTYTLDKIGYPTSFQWKRTKYITVRMDNADKTQEKYLIMNSRSILFSDEIDAEEMLKTVRNLM